MLYNPRMKWLFSAAVLLLIAAANASALDPAEDMLKNGVYSNADLGFRYTPPAKVQDITASARAQIQKQAAAAHHPTRFGLLLAMFFDEDDTAPDWLSIAIETLPRSVWPDLDDSHAESLMNASVVRGARSVGQNESATFSGQKFVVTRFELHEDSLTKHSTVYGTVRRGKLLSFAFAANATEPVDKMAETMKSLSFSGPN